MKKIVASAKRRNLRVVSTNGCFDILHIGHAKNLAFAKSLGDILIVGVNSDNSVRALKGRGRPIISVRERLLMLAALGSVDYVFVFSEKTPARWLRALKPDIHVKGGDRKRHEIVERKILKSQGTKLVLAAYIPEKSTTGIIEKILRSKRI